MSRLDALRALKKGVEDGRWDREAAWIVFGHLRKRYYTAYCAFRDDLNAARALHDAVRPGWEVDRITQARSLNRWTVKIGFGAKVFVGKSDKLARAWLLALIASLIDEEDGK